MRRIGVTQRLQYNRTQELQQGLDLAAGKVDRLEDTQRKHGAKLDEILSILREGRPS